MECQFLSSCTFKKVLLKGDEQQYVATSAIASNLLTSISDQLLEIL